MRKNALVLEIVGNYPLLESIAWGRLAVMFNLHYENVISSNLTDHSQELFHFTEEESERTLYKHPQQMGTITRISNPSQRTCFCYLTLL